MRAHSTEASGFHFVTLSALRAPQLRIVTDPPPLPPLPPSSPSSPPRHHPPERRKIKRKKRKQKMQWGKECISSPRALTCGGLLRHLYFYFSGRPLSSEERKRRGRGRMAVQTSQTSLTLLIPRYTVDVVVREGCFPWGTHARRDLQGAREVGNE